MQKPSNIFYLRIKSLDLYVAVETVGDILYLQYQAILQMSIKIILTFSTEQLIALYKKYSIR